VLLQENTWPCVRRSWKCVVLISRTLQLCARSWRPCPNLQQLNYVILLIIILRKENRLRVLMLIFWAVTPCGLVDRYQRFRAEVEAVCFSETLVSTYKSTRRHNSDEHRHLHGRENIRPHTLQNELKTGCSAQYLDLRKRKYQENAESHVISNFIIITRHQI
jgi:hypothetical protein